MKHQKLTIWLLSLLSAVLLSLPWLVPHTGMVALFALVPLLCAEYMATGLGVKRFWLCHYCSFVLWNALTTWWVCNATVGGGVFAVLANALQMSVVFGLFRFSRRRFSGVVPYIFLAVAWLAWEHAYFDAQISWPWLSLGHAFADSTRLVQWYSVTGMLGGSLWVLASNLAIFGMMVALSDGRWWAWNGKARFASASLLSLLLVLPPVVSVIMYRSYDEVVEDRVHTLIAQPDFDPYEKFTSMTQAQQTEVLLDLYSADLQGVDENDPILLLAPETFTGDIVLDNVEGSPTVKQFREFLESHQGCDMLFGASTYDISFNRSRPSLLARPYGSGWITNHNSALRAGGEGGLEVYHKSRLVVGTELTPYPRIFVPLDEWLSKKMGVGGLIGRCVGQPEASIFHFRDSVGIGCAVCYESIYGEYCSEYVRRGARALAVITNDAWWGNTPGYRQHLNYSRLRAIELRRDIARCANTGISAFIDQRGDICSRTSWWERSTLEGSVALNSSLTVFARYGDIIGRVSVMFFLLMLLALLTSLIMSGKRS